jgi:hypothetical protein
MIPGGMKIFLCNTTSLLPTIQCIPGTLSPGVKHPNYDANQSPTSSAEG